jgi:Xaa-Pro aminopeptidase
MSEAKIFATLDYESRMRDADSLAYPPVVAAGDNANTIHYTRYSKEPIDKKVNLKK